MRHLDTVDGVHPWSLTCGLILVLVSLCRRAGRKCFEGRFGRNVCVVCRWNCWNLCLVTLSLDWVVGLDSVGSVE